MNFKSIAEIQPFEKFEDSNNGSKIGSSNRFWGILALILNFSPVAPQTAETLIFKNPRWLPLTNLPNQNYSDK